MGAKINNAEIIKSIIDKAKIQLSVDNAPTELAEKIVPVLIAATAEKLIKFKSVTLSDGASYTIHTTHSTRDTYFVGFQISISKDAISNSTFTAINLIPFGEVSTSIVRLNYEPTTAGEHKESGTYEFPIKLEKSSNITLVNGAATASIDVAAVIMYYEVEP